MRTLVLLVCMGIVGTPALRAQSADETAALEVVESLFAHMKAGDTLAMRGLMHDDVRLVTTGTRDGAPAADVLPVERWLEGVAAATEVLDERIHDPEVRVDQNLATVWARYDLYVGQRHSHCGVDAFQLVRTSAGWKIIQIADTRAQEGCAG